MIPLGDLNPSRYTPWANRILLLLNLAAWIWVLRLSQDPVELAAFYDRYALVWESFVDALRSGSFSVDALLPMLTHMFLHGGWLHLLGNLLFLWIFGDNVEDRFGPIRYLGFYLLCGVAAAVGQGLISGGAMVGASGAIAGVLGAYLLMFPTARVRTLIFLGIFITVVQLPAVLVIGLWFVVQILSGLAELRVPASQATAQVAFFAHVFGFVAGAVLVLLMRPRRQLRLR